MVPAGGRLITFPACPIATGRETTSPAGNAVARKLLVARAEHLHCSHAGLVSGDISAPMPTSPWRGDQAVPTGTKSEPPPPGGSIQHAAASTGPARAVHERVAGRPRRPDRGGQAV